MPDPSRPDADNPLHAAGGVPALTSSLRHLTREKALLRGARALLVMNQAEGFDCMSCAWPDPDVGHRHTAEFCENGAKAVAEEATTRRAGPEFFAAHGIADLDAQSEHWLGQQGRITHPMIKRPGGTHYEPVGWDEAYGLVARHLNALGSPDEAIFYTSGKTSNEAAFAYQLFARAFGTNNLPDCSNMCHESTSVGLAEVIGIGAAPVDDGDDRTLLVDYVRAGRLVGGEHVELAAARERLANEAFMAKAPPAVVEGARAREAELAEQVERLRDSLAG